MNKQKHQSSPAVLLVATTEYSRISRKFLNVVTTINVLTQTVKVHANKEYENALLLFEMPSKIYFLFCMVDNNSMEEMLQ